MTFVVGLTQLMTPRGHGLTKGQLDLLKKIKKKFLKLKKKLTNKKIKKKVKKKFKKKI